MPKKSATKSTVPGDIPSNTASNTLGKTTYDATFDLVVAGAGMVGATAACLFAKQGLRVGLLDSKPIADWQAETICSPGYSRVSAINIAAMNIFKALGVWQAMLDKRVSRYRAMRVWEEGDEAGSGGAISFDAQDLGQPQLGFIIENDVIVSALIEKLRQNYNVSIMEGTSLVQRQIHEDKLVLLTADNKSLECGLLVGADGAQSKVRQLCDIDTASFDYQQDAIVTNVTTEKSHQNTAWQRFLPTGPVAMLPLQDGRCSLVWSCDRDYADSLMALSDERFCTALCGCFEQYLGGVLKCDALFRFPLRQYHAAHYIAKYTALAGDAAHITHPLAGLGANIGFMDVAALAEVVNTARNKGQNFSNHSVLRRYERWRKGENALVLGMMKGFKTVFGQAPQPIKTARHLGLNLADRIPPLKAQFAKYALGLSGDLPEICKG